MLPEKRGSPSYSGACRSGWVWPDRTSGVFVTDPMGGFPPVKPGDNGPDQPVLAHGASTCEGTLHNVCAVPIFAGIPLAGLISAVAATRRREYRWACYSAVSSFFDGGQLRADGSGIRWRVTLLR